MKNFVLGTLACAVLVGLVSRGGDFGPPAQPPEAIDVAEEDLDAWELAAKKQREERANKATPHMAQANASAAANAGSSRSLQRQRDGHFYSDVQVQGRTVNFLVDTGASMVALSEADARAVGVKFSPSKYRVIGEGASGPVRGQYVKLSTLTFGGRTLHNVPAVVLEGGRTSLLGQSVLSRYAIDMTGDRMRIR